MSHTTTRRSAGKIIAGVTLSLAIAFSGSALISPKQVEAASASSSSKASRVISIGKKIFGRSLCIWSQNRQHKFLRLLILYPICLQTSWRQHSTFIEKPVYSRQICIQKQSQGW